MIIENFLNQKEYKNIKEFMFGPLLRWHYSPYVSLGTHDHGITDTMAIDTFGFNVDIFNRELQYGDSEALSCMVPIIAKIIELNGQETQMLRIRGGLKTFKHAFRDGNYNLPHIDYHFPHKTLILYMNETDGDTFVFNEVYSGEDLTEFTIKERISPVENRAVILNGYQYHTASNPLYHDTRMILNINYI
jgi:hypothetical protein